MIILKINIQINAFSKFEESLNNTSNNKINISTNALFCNIEKLTNKICNTKINNKEESTKKKYSKLKQKVFLRAGYLPIQMSKQKQKVFLNQDISFYKCPNMFFKCN